MYFWPIVYKIYYFWQRTEISLIQENDDVSEFEIHAMSGDLSAAYHKLLYIYISEWAIVV
jgi:hypothetical protein